MKNAALFFSPISRGEVRGGLQQQLFSITGILLLIVLSLIVPPVYAGIYNPDEYAVLLPELLNRADEAFDLDEQDAVILQDQYHVYLQSDGRLRTIVQRTVWINSSSAIGHYADLRIPYDDAVQTFTVRELRTLRDGRWWESDTTGIVETLPHAVRTAYDYNDRREMMLLHDGVELPCILDVEYVIEDKIPFRKGVEGTWLFAKDDPVLESYFSFDVPIGADPQVFASEGVQVDEIGTDDLLGLAVHRFSMKNIPALPTPHTVDPASHTPYVSWSSWVNWDQFGIALKQSFESRMQLDNALRDSLTDLLDGAYSMSVKAKRIANFVDRSTRLIHYPERYWLWDPRSASRTYETAYGHRLDRAILAAALFQEAGFEIFPMYRGDGFGDINDGVATLDRMNGIAVWISGRDEVEAYYDPSTSDINNSLTLIHGRTVWIPGSGDDPRVRWRGDGTNGQLELHLNISYDAESDQWDGQGYYKVTQGLNPYGRMEGVENEVKDYLQSVVSGVIDGVEITGYNPITFNRFTVSMGFTFTAPLGEEQSGRYTLSIGEPTGGIFNRLPDDVHLYLEERDSPIRLASQMEQIIELRIDLEGWNVVYQPQEQDIANDVGTFQLGSDVADDRLVITRRLTLSRVDYSPDDWRLLRMLLLADRNERNRTLLIRRED